VIFAAMRRQFREDDGVSGPVEPAGPGGARRRWILRRWQRRIRRLPPALGIILGLIAADPADAGEIRAAQISGIVRLTPVAMIGSCLNVALVLATLAYLGGSSPAVWAWGAAVFTGALYYVRSWAMGRGRDPGRPASHRAIRRAILHGTLVGAAWGALPVLTSPGAPLPVQLLIGCVSSGAICAGGFVLATVPLAGACYVGMVMAGCAYALLADGGAVHLGLLAVLFVAAGMVLTNIFGNAQRFVDHLLTVARLRREVIAREQAQAEAAHAQRMTALGELAGGIAHDLNNILHVVAGSATLIARLLQEATPVQAPDGCQVGAQARQLSDIISDAAERGGSISRRLLAFARQDGLTAAPLEPAEFLQGATALLRHTLDRRTKLRVRVATGLPRLLADRVQLETVLVNLASNARDAMPGGGTLTIAAGSEHFACPSPDPKLPAGDYVRLSVTDDGVGMDAATLASATVPFFTTKPLGKGTGLGLAMARAFAEQSGGALTISSAPGSGTTVTLWLPATQAAAVADAAEPAVPAALDGRRHVLVVDDDALVRRTMIHSLADAGFVLSDAADGAGALDHIDSGRTVDILLTDLVMPGMNGLELIRAAHRRRPGLPAILLTGHMGVVEDDEPGARGDVIVLRKPVPPAQLAARLAAALEGNSRVTG
jgi:signal transduction histidine kinase/ActR/RegA family two-component response regulator